MANEPYMMLIRQLRTIKLNESLIKVIGQFQKAISKIFLLSLFNDGKQHLISCTKRSVSNMMGYRHTITKKEPRLGRSQTEWIPRIRLYF